MSNLCIFHRTHSLTHHYSRIRDVCTDIPSSWKWANRPRKAPNPKMVLHPSDSTVPKLINSGLLKRQLNVIWNTCSLKSSSLGLKHKLTRDAGCRFCKTTYGYAPFQVSEMGLRIHLHLQSNVNWPHQLLPSLPYHFNSSVTVHFDLLSPRREEWWPNLLHKKLHIKIYAKKLVSTTCLSKMSFMSSEHTTHLHILPSKGLKRFVSLENLPLDWLFQLFWCRLSQGRLRPFNNQYFIKVNAFVFSTFQKKL